MGSGAGGDPLKTRRQHTKDRAMAYNRAHFTEPPAVDWTHASDVLLARAGRPPPRDCRAIGEGRNEDSPRDGGFCRWMALEEAGAAAWGSGQGAC